MPGRLEGKVVLITGTSGGIGRASAIRFAEEGALVVGCGLTNVERSLETVRMVRAAGGQMISREPVDLGDPEQVQALVDLVDRTYGRLDVLYNNASAARFRPVAAMTLEDWRFTVRNELDIIYLMVKAALPLLVRTGHASIVNIASVSGLRGTLGSFAHAATKGGVLALTRQLAVELAAEGIRVNAIAPGVIATPTVEAMLADPVRLEGLLRNIPLRRLGRPAEIANVALFLASDESSFVTGATIVADGGETAG